MILRALEIGGVVLAVCAGGILLGWAVHEILAVWREDDHPLSKAGLCPFSHTECEDPECPCFCHGR